MLLWVHLDAQLNQIAIHFIHSRGSGCTDLIHNYNQTFDLILEEMIAIVIWVVNPLL